ncbi:hypothetical protein GDO78_020856 [Eleutherodactylus coqui]|nr:hypothetical protein GDO78_020856 [Eleutherodactylus coqui]
MLQKRAYGKRATTMWSRPLPLKKLQKNFWLLLLFTIFLLGVWTVYLQLALQSSGSPNNHRQSSWMELGKALAHNNIPALGPNLQFYRPKRPQELQESTLWNLSVPWRPEFLGRVNLHIFEDWCGSSIQQLRRNLLFPLFPHIHTTVSKLAITPQWTNYGLRMFGYLHPATDGEFQFAVSSDDNSEFWLSDDQSVGKLRLLCRVGPAGKQWTAPGEYGKFQDQISTPVRLSASKRYYFELLHKQDDAGTDHVELAWRQPLLDEDFTLIDSQFLSLFSDDVNLPLGNTSLIPLSKASHHKEKPEQHPADMLKEDPRDSAFKIHLLPMKRVHSILPSCTYKPSYLLEGYPLQRYQGLQFVHLTYVYPNDYTRLSHMEKDNECLYQENLQYRLRYNKYMMVDQPQPGTADHPGWPEDYKPSDFQYEDEDQLVDREEQEEPSENDIIRQRELFLVADEDTLPTPIRPNHRRRARLQENIRNRDTESLQNQSPKRSNSVINQPSTAERKNQKTPVPGEARPQKRKHTQRRKAINVTHMLGHAQVERKGSRLSKNKGRQNKNSKVQRDGRQKNAPQGKTLNDINDHQKMKEDFYRKQKLYMKELQGELDRTELPPGAKLQQKPKMAGARQDKMQRSNWNDEHRLKLKIREDVIPDNDGRLVTQVNHRMDKNLEQVNGGMEIHTVSQLHRKSGENATHPLKQAYTTYRRLQLSKDVRLEPQNIGWTRQDLEGKNQGHEDHDEGIYDGEKMGLEESVEKSQPLELSRQRMEQHVEKPSVTDDYQDRKQRTEHLEGTMQVTPSENKDGNGAVNEDVEMGKEEAHMEDERLGAAMDERQIQPPNAEENLESNAGDNQEEGRYQSNREDEEELEYAESEQLVFWNRTFNVSQTDFQVLRSDSIDLRCNTSGNLQLKKSEAQTIVGSFMKKLNQWHRGMYKLHKIINIEKHLDYARGSRYFLDVEFRDRLNHPVRFAHYVFAPGWTGQTKEVRERQRDMRSKMWGARRRLMANEQQMELCWPIGLVWNPLAMVYFIVPVKNQARWVRRFIWDMELLYQTTGDPNFSVIIVDFSSNDLNVREALKRSSLPR